MQLKNLLSDLKTVGGSGMQKTASESSPPTVSSARTDLTNALASALADVEKRASVPEAKSSPAVVDEITKIAADIGAADQEALAKEAQVFGACFADGFITRLAQYDESTDQAEKTAEEQAAGFNKWASENPEEFRAAFNQGFVDGEQAVKQAADAEMQKLASTPEGRDAIEAFKQGYSNTAAQLEKLAGTPEGQDKLASFKQGYADTMSQLTKIANEPGGPEKLAAMRQGFTDGTALVEKLASDYYTRGYNDTITLMQQWK